MAGILFTAAFAIIFAYAAYSFCLAPVLKKGVRTDNNAVYILIVSAAAFLLRVILAASYEGHATDMSCFTAWSSAVFEHGFSRFYTLEMFHDYPPGYMYVLYVIGALKSLLHLEGGALYVLIKLPAIICDIASCVIIYKLSKKHFSDAVSTIIAALYLFNPAVILNSSLWGQVDAVYTVFILLMLCFITEKKMLASYFVFALCIFIKPQAFIFTPVLIGGIINNVFLEDFSSKKLLKNIAFGIGSIALILLLSLPFGISNVFEQYKATLSSYPHLTVNAFNIWGAMGKNWSDLTTSATVIGYIFLAAISIYSVVLTIKSKNKSKYYFAGVVLSFLTYMLSTKMHDRYAFPSMVLMLAAFLTLPTLKNYLNYILLSLSQFFNTAWVLFIYEQDINKYFKSPVIIVASIINIAIMVYLIHSAQKQYIGNKFVSMSDSPKKGAEKKVSAPVKEKTAKEFHFSLSAHLPKVTKFDIIAMVVITAVYSGIALYDLGDMHAPENEYMLSESAVTIDLGQEYNISKFKYYLGSYELNDNRALSISLENENHLETFKKKITNGSVFHWEEENASVSARYVTLSADTDYLSVKEFALLDSSGNIISPASISVPAAQALFDEQDEVPERSTFRNGTYFDEIYHARTGYEFVHGLSVYEWTHPPLGKVFIALGIKLFGMCPFGWRIAGTVFGIIMIPIIYLFALKLLKKTWLAIITCLLFTFDFMHFAQTRIATIDVYVTFFIMLMYLFMYKYYSTSFYDTSFKKGLVSLALCGTFMGFGIASKWTGIYAGAGLCILFCITIYRRYNEYRFALKNPSGETDGISHQKVIQTFKPQLIKTVIWCCFFFIVVPIVIYGLSYIPYLKAPDEHGLASIMDNQNAMLTYHAKTVLGSTHPFSSRWYEWIIMKRPIWYYSGTAADGLKEGISSFGNPLVWWLGVPAFFYMVYRTFKNRDKNSLFLVIAYLAQLVSWIPVTRLTFIYHYFPCVPFIVLMIGYSIYTIYDAAKDMSAKETAVSLKFLPALKLTKIKFGSKKFVILSAFIYALLVLILFAMFYPVLSGQPCSQDYADHFLKWFDSWVLL